MIIKPVVLWCSAVLYGLLIAFLVPYWSFDYDVLVSSAVSIRQNEQGSFLDLLVNNVVLLYIWDSALGFLEPADSVAFLYGFAATIRVLVLFSLFRFRLCLPLFVATAVFNDLNVCRYSLGLSLTLLTLSRLGPIRASVMLFPIHIFMPATIFMLSIWTRYWRVAILILSVLMAFVLPDLFARTFAVLENDPFPRIAFVYCFFAFILFAFFRREIAAYSFNFAALLFGLAAFSLLSIPFSNAYYFRFSNLAFESILLLIAFYYSGLRNLSSIKISSLRFGAYVGVCFLASLYSIILIGGNLWRFF